ncbi:MAG: hypothetical protein IKZ96_00970 [Bacilli bacterium]|nr:hypothetical protein [Bacilli bacterium]
MIDINKLINLLNRRESNKKISKLYKKYSKDLFKEVRSLPKFRAYIKSAVIADFNESHERETIDTMLRNLENTSIFSDYVANVIFMMNASCSKVGDKTGRVTKDEINELFEFEGSLDLLDLNDREDEILNIIKDMSGFVTFDEIISGDYKKSKNFNGNTLTVGEIRNLFYVKMIPGITQYIHRKYDDQVDGEVHCLFPDIEESLKRFAFHSKSCRSCFLIVFDDETIISYNNGEYRFLPYKFSHVIYLTKLEILTYLAYGADDDNEDMVLRMLADDGEYANTSISDMDDELFEQLTRFAYNYIRSFLDEFTFEFSEIMIKDAKEKIGKYKILSSKYKL